MVSGLVRGAGGAAVVVTACLAVLPASAADDRQVLTAAYDESGQQLFRLFRAKPEGGNIVFSPYSIGTAMAMVLAGARNDTEREMASVLRLPQTRANIAAANSAVLATLNGYDRGAVTPTCPTGTKLVGESCEGAPAANGACPARSIRDKDRCVAAAIRPDSARLRAANALMLGKETGDLISKDYAALLKATYAADVFRNVSLDDVNGWVRERTEGKIEKLLDRLDPSAPAVILNAVYFKADWRTPFTKAATAPAAFRLSPSRDVQVPTMRLRSSFAVRAGGGYRAIRLPYKVAALSMTVVLPDRVDGLESVADRLNADELAKLLAALRAEPQKSVALTLPRFKTHFRASLGTVFQTMGMKKAFELNAADFSGMTGRPPAEARIAISDVVHEAVIDVTEEGTEAAAATAIAMAMTSFKPKIETFEIDRPFLFVISDDATGAILFQGRIVDPR